MASVDVPLYTRQATGLVRELSVRDNIVLSLALVSLPLGFLYITLVPGLYQGADVGLGFLLTGILFLPHIIVYGLLGSILPRSGGDYVFLSRTIHPSVGFVMNGLLTLVQISGTANICIFISTFGLPALFQALTLTTGNARWAHWATDVSSKNGQFAIAAGVILVIGLVAMISVRLLVRLAALLLAATIVGILFTVGALLAIDQSQFNAHFSEFGSVTKVMTAAKAGGFQGGGFSIAATFASVLFLYTATAYSQVATYWGGEVQRAKRTMLPSLLATIAIATAVFALVSFLAERSFGRAFLGASQYVTFVDAKSWPFDASPFLNLFIGIGEPHAWLIVLLGVTYVAGIAAVVVPTYMLCTRNVFAYAFDRILPMKLASVNDRTHTPVVATLSIIVITMIYLAFFVYRFASQIIVVIAIGSLVILILFFFVGVSAAILPYRQPELYDSSPLKRNVLGLPVLTILGVIDAIIMFAYVILLMFTHWGTAVGSRNATGLKGLAVTVVLLIAIWVGAWYFSRRRGLSLTEVQKLLPPE